MSVPERIDGFAPIGGYGLIGDGRSTAPVAARGLGHLGARHTGARQEGNAFDALVRADRAREVWTGAAGHAGEPGLLSEEVDAVDGAARGNLPRAPSHLALTVAACRLRDAEAARTMHTEREGAESADDA